MLAADWTLCAVLMSRAILRNPMVGQLRIARLTGWTIGAVLLFIAAFAGWKQRWRVALVAFLLGMTASLIPAYLFWLRLQAD